MVSLHDQTAEPFLVRPDFNDRSPMFSPDGRWVAYVSDESGVDEVYVTPYRGPGSRELVSIGGGREPVWSREAPELFYRVGDLESNTVMAVAIELEPTFRVGTPEPLFEGAYYRELNSDSGSLNYDVNANGDRFLMVKAASADGGQWSRANDMAAKDDCLVLGTVECEHHQDPSDGHLSLQAVEAFLPCAEGDEAACHVVG